MKARRGTAAPGDNPDTIAATLTQHRDDILEFVRARPRCFDCLVIDYPSLVADPGPFISRLHDFLGEDLLPFPDKMSAVIRTDLHRQQGGAAGGE